MSETIELREVRPGIFGAEFPDEMYELTQPHPYKVLYGGRGASKSWAVARWLLIEASQKSLRVLCGRETQKSISDSVHRLLSDQIVSLGLQDRYIVERSRIYGVNGSEFTFAGLRHNIDNIKSIEGTDRLWFEEAQTGSHATWTKLLPTIRRPGAEIIVTFNPELATDETYKRFVLRPPPEAWVRKFTYRDNPWFPEILRAQMRFMRDNDPDEYLWVWGGECRQTLDGAIYAKEMREAAEGGRITRIPYDQSKPVHTFWDLGRGDHTSIWFVQMGNFEFRCIDYYENRGHHIGHYLKELQSRPYVYGDCWLPHDAANEYLASKRSVRQQVAEAGYKVRDVPKTAIATGINAARSIFPMTWFDEDRCSDGLDCLRRYRYEVDPETKQYSKEPLHDEWSDGADAFRYMAVALKEPKRPTTITMRQFGATGGQQGWMGR